ncbi:AAA-ATPase like domain containing protein [Asbolus verrucosus]|uniref:AAA-ATPase like domain containing protein n=1 Tax=Asbolus verrucosus TaxID=1661398 RepID=A0A482V7T2_ASBVE|nr:AAA-ATPase like domain containing protein [Asbolus verrucosus]
MDQADSDDDGDLNISTDSDPPSGKPDKMLGTSNFLALLGTINESYYIDKTNLIDVFLNCGRSRVLVTAPRRFGKTINIAMLETFFVLQVSAGESIIQAAVKENLKQNWIKYAFITGISHIAGMGLSGSNIKPFRFLENHDFVPYYGLTAGDVTQLLQKTYGFYEDRIEEVRKKFNGYSTVRGVKIYNTWSVLEYASKTNEDDFTYEWQDTGYIVGLKEAFRFPEIMKIVQTKLLLDHPIEIKKLKFLTLEDVLDLVNIIGEVDPQNVDYPRPDLFFSFILEQGYLSFVKKKLGQVVIPNDQIKKQIEDKLTDFTIGVFDGDTTYIEKCKEFLLKISKMNCDHDDFKKFHVNLEVVLQKYAARWIKKNEANIRCTIKILVDNLRFKDCAELLFNFESLGVEVKRILDFIVIKDDFVMIWEIKYKESNKKAMLCIKDREYLKVLKNKNIIRSPVTRWVLMGINMDENGQVSIGYLQNSENFDDMTLIP